MKTQDMEVFTRAFIGGVMFATEIDVTPGEDGYPAYMPLEELAFENEGWDKLQAYLTNTAKEFVSDHERLLEGYIQAFMWEYPVSRTGAVDSAGVHAAFHCLNAGDTFDTTIEAGSDLYHEAGSPLEYLTESLEYNPETELVEVYV
ncbi:hypothetical protein [Corynebacterium sp. NML120713]|uniref:hypothetical protein n=1 Tax=Corynebacterium sp. NML120713 TaxID=1906332 RepID=UPI0008FAE913|nr:hypothetical protein [Corynebacterium sp. NML120713]OIR43190.1 hypothetical protein BJP06_06315 [Corynebacterium sp. NML120713]